MLSTLPKWSRIVVIVLVSACLALVGISVTSCSTVRVVGNAGNSKVEVRQHALDSMQVNVNFIPK